MRVSAWEVGEVVLRVVRAEEVKCVAVDWRLLGDEEIRRENVGLQGVTGKLGEIGAVEVPARDAERRGESVLSHSRTKFLQGDETIVNVEEIVSAANPGPGGNKSAIRAATGTEFTSIVVVSGLVLGEDWVHIKASWGGRR